MRVLKSKVALLSLAVAGAFASTVAVAAPLTLAPTCGTGVAGSTFTPTSSSYTDVLRPQIVVTVHILSPARPHLHPHPGRSRWRLIERTAACTARSAATTTRGSSTPGRPTTARRSAVAVSAPTAADASRRSRRRVWLSSSARA